MPSRPRSRLFVSALKGLFEGLVGLAFPPVCLGCGERVDSPRRVLCLPCIRSADRADPAEIAVRIARLPQAGQAVDFAFALWIFDKGGILQEVHHALKYGNRPAYGLALGEILGAALLRIFRPQPDVIVPVPLHASRLYERGYNQSERLAAGISRMLHVAVDASLLVRTRSTRSQTALSREDRWKNLSDAFETPVPEALEGRRVLLVDDVLTTGATCGAAARALKDAGAVCVDLAALALART